MKTRLATLADLDALIAQVQPFLNESPYKDKIAPNGEDFFADLARKIDVGILIVCEADDGRILGSIGGVLCVWSSNHSVTIAYENWLYIEPAGRGSGCGGALIDAFEARAKEMGCAGVELTYMNNASKDIVARSYEKRGYALTQFVHTKIF